jgi:hypothetical protein
LGHLVGRSPFIRFTDLLRFFPLLCEPILALSTRLPVTTPEKQPVGPALTGIRSGRFRVPVGLSPALSIHQDSMSNPGSPGCPEVASKALHEESLRGSLISGVSPTFLSRKILMTFRSMNWFHALVLIAPLTVAVGCQPDRTSSQPCKKDKDCSNTAICDSGSCQFSNNVLNNNGGGSPAVVPHTVGVSHP